MAQQTKLDLELIPKENRLDIGKCNGRIPRGLKPKEETFQVVLDALALTPCYPAFLITADVPEVYMHQFWNCIYKHDDFYRFKIDKKKRFKLTLETRVINSLNDVVIDQMHQPWRTFAALINRSLSGKTSGLDKLRLSRAQILWGMYHQKNVDYVELLWEDFTYQIDNKVYKKQERDYPQMKESKGTETYLGYANQVGASQGCIVLPECLTSPEMKESKAYKTYLSYATGEVPPKVARKFKKASPSKKEYELVPVETKSKRKEKEKVDVAHGKGIELLSEVALSEKAQMKEVRKKSLREFYKTNPSGFGTIAEKPPSVEKITPTVTSEGTGDKPGVPDVTNDDSSESKSESWDEESDDDDQEKEEFDQENESEDDEMKSDEEQGIDDTTDQFDDGADARLEEPIETATGIVQGEGNDTEMTKAQQGNENLETTQEQVVEDAHVTISTVPKKIEVHVTSSSCSSDLASKFLKFSNIPQTDAEIVSPLDVHVHHEVPRT
ncbi:hypothetical protein Tco_1346584 [Tanacetum coccineum]